ncbi:putative LacI family transcriptional regulator [Paenibacillus sp. 598K]|uniref:sugar ABC transporter substrate-binding protein n=1 Tax=Paenibacillus sp. 598K TaxID=1117987 RepID=UPI000FFA3BCD|nr:substrate-binding domain-containing protein [Paenibacillus sp. 598K]GBF76612.1 putative LacI family transcriptional regulator [Paenibacillus sp. 598K]
MERSSSTAKRLPAILALLMLVCAAGCLPTPPEEGYPAISYTESKDKQPAHLTLGILYPMAHPFYEMITQMAEKAAVPLGIDLIVKAPDEVNLEQQIRILEQMIKQRVDGIAISPVDGDALTPVIDRAVEAGIPVVCFEMDAPGSKRLSYIGANHYEGGKLVGEVLDQLLKGKGMVLVESGFPHLPAHKLRLAGMLEHIQTRTDIQILDIRHNSGSEDQALVDMEVMIDAHPHFDAFVSLDLWSASSSILVWKAKGLSRDIIAFGMQSDIKEAIHNGQITSVISQNEQDWAVEIIASLMSASQNNAVPDHIDTGSRVLTRDTVDTFPDVAKLRGQASH